MSPLRSELLIPILITIVIFVFVYFKSRKKVEQFIFKTWFKRTTKIYGLRKLFYILGIITLLVSLLDFRGPEEKIESNIPDQKTIVIIDSSASMLAEDVRPNRYKKSLIMARHFVKKAFGHKVAVVLFSDQQKRLVPFTDDLDLIDARIAGLETVDLYDGGSNISQAIRESLGYFKNSSDEKTLTGNILVFTDSEGHDEDFTFSIPAGVSLAIVGVGTARGARIPHRDRNGVFRGYKKYNNEEVVSKLNEDWLKSLNSKVTNYKYWVASSFTIPTQQIMDFFNNNFEKRLSKGFTTIRPVMVDRVLVPGIILLILSFILYPAVSFKYLLVITLGLGFSEIKLYAQSEKDAKELLSEDETEALNDLINRHKQGLLNQKEKMRMAEYLSKSQSYEMATTIYNEAKNSLTKRDINNYAINLIKEKKSAQAIKLLSELQSKIDDNDDIELKKDIRQNMLLALATDKQQKKEQQEKEKNKDKEKDKEKEKKNQQDQNGEGGEDQNENKQNEKQKEGKQNNKDNKKQNKENKKEKDKDKEQNSDDQKDGKEKQSPKSLKEKQKEIETKRKMVKIPGLIKQLMSDDRELQQKYIDTRTDKPKSFNKKDW